MEKAEYLAPDNVIWAPTSGGTLLAFEPPFGKGIRVDTCGYNGYATNANYDPLIAKIIVSASSGSLGSVFNKCKRALEETRIEGVETNAQFLKAILNMPDVEAFGAADPKGLALHTKWIDEKLDQLCEAIGWKQSADGGGNRDILQRNAPKPRYFTTADLGTAVAQPAGGGSGDNVLNMPPIPTPAGTVAVTVPMQATIVTVDAKVGEQVKKGQQLGVLNAMKVGCRSVGVQKSQIRLISRSTHRWSTSSRPASRVPSAPLPPLSAKPSPKPSPLPLSNPPDPAPGTTKKSSKRSRTWTISDRTWPRSSTGMILRLTR